MHPTLLTRTLLVAGLLVVTLGACGGSSDSSEFSGTGSGGSLSSGGSGTDTAGSSTATAGTSATPSAGTGNTAGGSTGGAGTGDIPCEVQAMLAAKCTLCHKADPPGTLLTSADFRKPSKTDPAKTVGQVALERLSSTTSTRMPPAPLAAATDAEIAALSSWVKAGNMATSCGATVPPAPDPYGTPLVCTSMKTWTGGNRESPLMHPGGTCISCHKKEGEGPVFAVAGTLFPTAHEPDDCNGVSSTAGAQVVVTEANGTVHTLPVNQAGNFYLEARTFALPYQAKVVYQNRERVMVESQQSGDCNDCHTQDGRQNAPGRIFLP